MGRGWIKGLGIELRSVMDVKAITSVEGLVTEYASVFDDALGTFKGTVGVGGAIKNTCGRTSPQLVRLLDCRLSDRLLHRRQYYRLCNKLRQPRSACRNERVCNRLRN
ncbi:hypothetical protein MRX96_023052 [Rhipicephalus microplus]